MPRFDPFSPVNYKYGAPMGRSGDDPATCPLKAKLFTRHCGGDGYYDRGGAYWGHPNVYAVWTKGGEFCAYLGADTPKRAIALADQLRKGA